MGYANYTSAGVEINKDYGSNEASGTGRAQSTVQTLSDTQCFIKLGISATASETLVFNTPCIRLGAGESAFVM
jgi:hypothetical protein